MKIERDENGDEQIIIANEDDYFVFAEAFEKLQARAAVIASRIGMLKGIRSNVDPDEIYMENGNLFFDYEEGCCGSYDTYSELIPTSYLFDPEWVKEAEAEIAEKKERERQEAERKRLKAEAAKKEREYKQYLELQAKFGGSK